MTAPPEATQATTEKARPRTFGAYWRYPLSSPALAGIMSAGGYRLWWYGLFFRDWSVGVMVRRKETS